MNETIGNFGDLIDQLHNALKGRELSFLDVNEQNALLDALNEICSKLEHAESESDVINIAEKAIRNLRGFQILCKVTERRLPEKKEFSRVERTNLATVLWGLYKETPQGTKPPKGLDPSRVQDPRIWLINKLVRAIDILGKEPTEAQQKG